MSGKRSACERNLDALLTAPTDTRSFRAFVTQSCGNKDCSIHKPGGWTAAVRAAMANMTDENQLEDLMRVLAAFREVSGK